MKKVLLISGHPNLTESNANRTIIDKLETRVEGIEVRRLDSLYPDYIFDIDAEQQALLSADIVIFQFPFYWYSVPGLMKLWLDEVFTFNFSYGPAGDKLKGKELILSFTIGGPAESYQPLGYNHFPIEQLLLPLQQTAYLSQMTFNRPIYTHRMIYVPGVYNTLEDVEARANEHASRLIAAINELRGN